ncbi:hypothetical protein H1R17_08310 [Flavobacterium sp. xlx-214]|uniref:hypothetical protein n=1 Tax=unclassified Flavobacterium TaxID=196869 RepID=UPI0013D63EB9|nr:MULTISPECIES: hypothetical protein [unclassified Flavobacterium]MBA5793227.1 hypothetical protein [Flavobacterium sp. xlx-221]QMI82490.1 hypothetical protein H1R17_08310 [Flavobacterium sp. xlx-214]
MTFRFLITFFLLISFISTSAQDEESQCVRVDNFSIEQRNQKYPFNKATKIVFASFKGDESKLPKNKRSKDYDGERALYVEGQIMQIYFDILKKRPSKFNPDHFEEKVELSENQKNELTDLIFNVGNNIYVSGAKCYMPRNAILFFGDNNKLIEFVEICFECNNYRTSNEKIDLNNNCGEKLYLLKEQFSKAGIQYGIVN